ncbi:hypothetical protein HanIR_Chr11g0510791 [Helianthus annuus]|nr:hypothetical protein HanIR_Chr11g0510791 [Helianthus annuus]
MAMNSEKKSRKALKIAVSVAGKIFISYYFLEIFIFLLQKFRTNFLQLNFYYNFPTLFATKKRNKNNPKLFRNFQTKSPHHMNL